MYFHLISWGEKDIEKAYSENYATRNVSWTEFKKCFQTQKINWREAKHRLYSEIFTSTFSGVHY